MPPLRSEDLAACSAELRGGSRTFFAASLLLPRDVSEPASALYAFCRLADDAIDLAPVLRRGPGDATADSSRGADVHDDALHDLTSRLDALYAGTPAPIAADRALAEVVARYGIPRKLFDALLEGFCWDRQGRRYETLADLHDYCARVAGTVGAMMAVVMGVRSPQVVARACDLGVAMQLSNIARDVGEDARSGRLYLPRQWLRQAGIDVQAWLRAPVASPALAGVVQRLLQEADRLYARAALGITGLPRSCRPGIHAARLIYAEIGRQLEREGLDPVARRAVVPGSRKAALIGSAMFAALSRSVEDQHPVLPAVQFLVEAVTAEPAQWQARREGQGLGTPWWNVSERAVWVIGLFERLERLERREHNQRNERMARLVIPSGGR